MATVTPTKRRLPSLRPALRWARTRKAPWFVTWALTERCNYRCDHCGCWRAPDAEMDRDRALSYARDMVRLGVIGVNLCGGEVLLRKDLGEVLAILHDGGVITRITSNGSLVPQRIDDLRGLSRLKISLDGPPDLHDHVRGPGAFDAVVAAVHAARGARIRVQLNTVLTRGVIARYDELLDTVGDLGSRVSFQPLELRHELAARGVDAVTPTPQLMRAAVARILSDKERGDLRIGSSAGTLQYMSRWPELPPMDCHAGKRFCRVLSDGRVVACDRPVAPHEPPPPGAAPPSFAAGVTALKRAGACVGCFRNNTIELNRALGGHFDAWDAVRKWI